MQTRSPQGIAVWAGAGEMRNQGGVTPQGTGSVRGKARMNLFK